MSGEGEGAPRFWMYEVGGVLRPAVMAYLGGMPLAPEQIDILRAYLRQWIAAPAWAGPDIERLRAMIDGLTTRAAIDHWVDRALDSNIDPF